VQEHELPTWNEIVSAALDELDRSRDGLSEATSWLRSDWRPAGTALSAEAGDARAEARRLIGQAKELVDQAKDALGQARNGTGH
jgi:hypothetical protein